MSVLISLKRMAEADSRILASLSQRFPLYSVEEVGCSGSGFC